MYEKQHAGYAGDDAEPECAAPGQAPYQPRHSETHTDAEHSEYEEENTHGLRGSETFQRHQRHHRHDDGSIKRLQGKQDKKR